MCYFEGLVGKPMTWAQIFRGDCGLDSVRELDSRFVAVACEPLWLEVSTCLDSNILNLALPTRSLPYAST